MAREISREEVRHMASLSRLILDDCEEALLARQLGRILEHMDILNSVDTANIRPLYSPAEHAAITREDARRRTRERSQVLANAPETDGECFIVPRII